jgi:hypothetical protein
MQNIMQTSHGLDQDMSRISSRETRAQNVSSSMRSITGHPKQNMKTSRVSIGYQRLEILQHCQAMDFVNFLTRDESWFFWNIPIMLYHGVWAASRDAVPETLMTKIDPEKCMISIIWSISGIHSLLALTKDVKYKFNSQYLCQYGIPDIQQRMCSSSHTQPLKRILLHLNNASTHNSRLSSEKMESAKAQRV